MDYINLTQTIANRFSRCNKRKVGAVVVRGDVLISVGFNHGYVEQCECKTDQKNPNVIHAEQMALSGDKNYDGAVIYINYPPCSECMDLIKSKGISETVYLNKEGVECKI